jgi:hypothetical protein
VTAFVVAGVSLATGLGTASASDDPGRHLPLLEATCLLPLPLLCDDSHEPQPRETWSEEPDESKEPEPADSWPGTEEHGRPWRPAAEEEHRVPRGHPETGGGALAADEPVWPFAVGGAALLTGAGLAGFAVRHRRDVV